ncbi:MAG: hypothetical protein A2504_06715 [Bdellovibrionales bacterium RIFOXYD12_FULL_39_22]|nr:MAG: hypothetical protein A2385_09035 [Bdellovibrionales bacterium RIFOXYB1_FULL_39_21]OFZ45157.1 MAG: hypothetical protein A2485_05500 [Bdellovibrionales bacterium RIFOXYC12_FULL_39_17]OFZ45651.1 MAG: hypothetical protein A2404_03615 [Bdellovibrionales bacterium RIFOXYC1_FULL_39_130]OFZ73833.1 MAG: hypothetical protein A2451_12270 [Bdellovibrionales bacterium RIFOXYC2_FULL_39_8]OFZ77513.1 MAG: hypothetical protein A2560_09205 [Bdellovibrionales bacterium RIFOXYD1_FULL_39_84]OFZ91642.1 MAG:
MWPTIIRRRQEAENVVTKKITTSPIVAKYLQAYEKDPKSTLFAPLAEGMRKIGMVDRAIKILESGLRYHPGHVLGVLGLAQCYFDLGEHTRTFDILRPIIGNNRENIKMQKLFAHVCMGIGKLEDALETYKYLLFLNPNDKEAAQFVKGLESQGIREEDPLLALRDSTSAQEKDQLFAVNNIDIIKESADWVPVENSKLLSEGRPSMAKAEESFFDSAEEFDHKNRQEGPEDEWQIKSHVPTSIATESVGRPKEEASIQAPVLSRTTTSNTNDDGPVITHTLVDLYCAQGHHQRALEILNKMLALNPNDHRTIEKMEEVQKIIKDKCLLDEGRKSLMDLFDSKITPAIPVVPESGQVKTEQEISNGNEDRAVEEFKMVEKRMLNFLTLIKKRANTYLSEKNTRG